MEAVVGEALLLHAGQVRRADAAAEGVGATEPGVVDQDEQDVGRALGFLDGLGEIRFRLGRRAPDLQLGCGLLGVGDVRRGERPRRLSDPQPARKEPAARNIAKQMVKQAIKAAGGKVSLTDPKDITAAANELLKEQRGIG